MRSRHTAIAFAACLTLTPALAQVPRDADLINAAERGDTAVVVRLIKEGASQKARDAEVVRMAVAAGAVPQTRSPQGF